MIGVYLIKNTLTDKVYVGSSKDIKKRWKDHKHELNKGNHHCPGLLAAWRKYGAAAFVFEVLELCPPEVLSQREQYWIDTLRAAERDAGYNAARVADRVDWTPETRTKMATSLRRRAEDPEVKAWFSAHHKRNWAKKTPEEREAHLALLKSRLTPEVIARRNQAIREAFARKKAGANG